MHAERPRYMSSERLLLLHEYVFFLIELVWTTLQVLTMSIR